MPEEKEGDPASTGSPREGPRAEVPTTVAVLTAIQQLLSHPERPLFGVSDILLDLAVRDGLRILYNPAGHSLKEREESFCVMMLAIGEKGTRSGVAGT